MPQIQIPDFEGQNLERERLRQNAMANISNLRTARLQQNALAMRNQDMQRSMQKRAELESVLGQTPEPERDRVAYEWSKVNDPDFHLKLQGHYISRMVAEAPLDPEGAVMRLNRATGENVKFVGGAKDWIEMKSDDGKTHLFNWRTRERQEFGQGKPTVVPQGSGVMQPGEKTPSYTQPFRPEASDKTLSPTELFNQNPRQFEVMKETEARIGAKYRKPDSPDRLSASQELQKKRLLMTIKSKKDRALATLEREYRSPAAFGRFEPMSDEELLNRKQQIQTDFEDDLNAAGFEATPFNYSDQSRSSQLSTGHSQTGGITREQALQELRRRGVVR